MRMYVGGQWIDKSRTIPVENPFDQRVIDTVPRAGNNLRITYRETGRADELSDP